MTDEMRKATRFDRWLRHEVSNTNTTLLYLQLPINWGIEDVLGKVSKAQKLWREANADAEHVLAEQEILKETRGPYVNPPALLATTLYGFGAVVQRAGDSLRKMYNMLDIEAGKLSTSLQNAITALDATCQRHNATADFVRHLQEGAVLWVPFEDPSSIPNFKSICEDPTPLRKTYSPERFDQQKLLYTGSETANTLEELRERMLTNTDYVARALPVMELFLQPIE